MIEEFRLEGPLAQWRAVVAEIRSDILAHGYNAELGSFVQSYNSKWLQTAPVAIRFAPDLACHFLPFLP
jgi:hypothetical protein